MNLNKSAFARVRDGSKTIELRLLDEKRKLIKLDDVIEFSCESGGDKIQKRVVGLVNFRDFRDLIYSLPLELFGCESREVALAEVNAIYSVDRQRGFSVLGIVLGSN